MNIHHKPESHQVRRSRHGPRGRPALGRQLARKRVSSHRRAQGRPPISHDQNFKNLILDFPGEALAFFLPKEQIPLDDSVVVRPIRQEASKLRFWHRNLIMDTPLRVEWPDGEREPLIVLLEEDTVASRFDPLRLNEYLARLMRQEKTQRVVVVVIFLRRGKIERALVAAGDHTQTLKFTWVPCELAGMQAADFADSPNIVARLVSVCMQYPSDREARMRVYGQAVQGLLTLVSDPDLQRKYLDFVEDYLTLDASEWRLYERLYPTENRKMGAFTQRWLEKGRQEGILLGTERGIEIGEARGLLTGQRQTVARQLARRFGPLNPDVEARLASATKDELDYWADALLTARSLDEVFRLQ